MDAARFDVIVTGAGIAGASAGWALAGARRRVAVLEMEEQAGYHSTGRSAALWILNYGPPDVRALTFRSRAFFEHPPQGFAAAPLMRRRPVVFLATGAQRDALAAMLAEGIGLREAALAEVHEMVPALRPGYAVAAAIEDDAFDMDVAAIHQGFLAAMRRMGGTLVLGAKVEAIGHADSEWRVQACGTDFVAPVLVNAAGAWGDEIARLAGIAPLGLTPCRRTALIVDPAPYDVTDWPLLNDVGHTWYARPEARTRLMVSPADQTPTHPHDVQAEEIDIALAVDRMQQALAIEVRRVERSWAGLRTFTRDGSLAIGWEPRATGFFWCVGQGGYGIQTSPAAGRLVADLIRGAEPDLPPDILRALDPARFAMA